jgi:CheY-like chemotaxis protein
VAKILVVEDNDISRDILARLLKREGHEVLFAGDGRTAVEIALAEQPAVILMDLSLPVMDGWEATRRIKGHRKTEAIPVIALTAHAFEKDVKKARASGCDYYETKPVVYPRLMKKIQSLVDRES